MSTHNALVVENADLISRLTAAKAELDAMRAERDEQKADAHKWFGIALDNKHRYEAAEAREQALLTTYDAERKAQENVLAEVARLTDALHDAQQGQWPEWAARILKCLQEFGWRFDDVIDLPDEVENYLRDCPDSATVGLIESRDDAIQRAEKAEAELSAMRAAQDALVAAAYEAAAGRAARRWELRREHADRLYEMAYAEAKTDAKFVSGKADEAEMIAAEIRDLTPADAVAALADYARAERNKARRESAAVAKEIADQFVGYMGRIERAILARIEKEVE